MRAFLPAMLLLAALPLLWPTVPPLVDLLNSMSRYRIALDYGTSPYFRQWFDFHWVVAGNLGVDIPVALLAPLMGIEPATKLVIVAIPMLTVAGMAFVAREIHGRVPLTAAFAFVFAYNYALNFGFVNYCMGAGLALNAFGLWLRLGRLGKTRLRTLLFVPVSVGVWFAHTVGWGLMGAMIFPAEVVSQRQAGKSWPLAFLFAVAACLPMLAALVPMLAWMSGGSFGGAMTTFHFGFARKFIILELALKNYIDWIDMGSVGVVFVGIVMAIGRRDIRFDPRLVASAAMLLLVYLVMPDAFMGSGFVDLRIAPFALALFALAFAPIAETRFTKALGGIAIAFLALHTAYQTATFAHLGRLYDRQLAAVEHIPVGSRVFGLASIACLGDFHDHRMDHINRVALVRRQAYTNDTWPPTTASGLIVHPDLVTGYHDLDSQKLLPADCRFGHDHDMPGALASIPRAKFDYLWVIDVPQRQWPKREWLTPVWNNGATILYRIHPSTI